jgi:hypothetical protein
MSLFSHKHDDHERETVPAAFWPQDRLDDVDDATFARAIAEGRLAEHRDLVDA